MEKYIKDVALARDFCKGKSAKYFKCVHENKIPLRVTKNGMDYVVILDFQKYIELIDMIEKKKTGVVKNA